MSNASQCRRMADAYAERAAAAHDPQERRTCGKLQGLWLEMAALAERFDRDYDGSAKEQIYAKIEEVAAASRNVA